MKITQTKAWKALEDNFQESKNIQIRELFSDEPGREDSFSLSLDSIGLFLDYSKNRITDKTLNLLLNLATTANLEQHIQDLFNKVPVNFTEQRPALHTLLRNADNCDEVQAELNKMSTFVDSIHQHTYKGFTGKSITDVVNIGIGGSDLGPKLVVDALKPYHQNNVSVHFVANIDASDILSTLKHLNPETTLFIIASKSFTTIETLTNAKIAKQWLNEAFADEKAIATHMLAITAKYERAIDFGIEEKNIFTFWDWVGGRYSLWSSIGLPIALSVGMENFKSLLAGAHTMDEHFRTADLRHNMPVLLALISVWYINFFHCQTQAIIPYDHSLSLLPSYLQQLEMESNGKSVNRNNEIVDYNTAPIIWGGVGSNGQHAFHQLLHQGTHLIPIDFIIALNSSHSYSNQHKLLYHNCLAQSQALMEGCTKEQAMCELVALGIPTKEASKLAMHKRVPGNKPSNTLLLSKLTPHTLGALIALYEHKVYAQSILWQINSFDQYGVELGKQLSKSLSDSNNSMLDKSTIMLLERFIVKDSKECSKD